MAWMMDTYSMNSGTTATGVVTGKPVDLGGSLGRVKATGRGVFKVGTESARLMKLNVNGARVAVQGFGNVGSVAAELFAEAGAKIVCIQDQFATIHNRNGIDVAAALKQRDQSGRVEGTPDTEIIEAEQFWDVDCDILIPAALESQITAVRAQRIKARLILEGANGPTLPEADDILLDRGVRVVPDVICNAGGVIVSYFEWVQDFSSFFWNENEINQRLDNIIVHAFNRIYEVAARLKVSMRVAAFVVACERILKARQERGLYP